MKNEPKLTIGEVASQAGVRTSAIRYYERRGVLPRAERVSGQRRYHPETVERLGLIGAAKQAGFNLEEVGELLRSSDEGSASKRLRELADRKLPEVEALIDRAERMKQWLELASDCGCSTLEACGLFATGEPDESSLEVTSRTPAAAP